MKEQDLDRINNLRFYSRNSEIYKLAQFAETLYSDNKVREELEQLELKSDELDRRELGAHVLVRGIPPTKVHQCGHCEAVLPVTLKMKYYNYCSHCGYRLIHPEPETYTVQINGKDVVLQKGEDYVVIPKKEICYL